MPPSNRTLVTGFGPFGDVQDNPSAQLARSLERRHEVLPVSYEAVRAFLDRLDPGSFEVLLILGVSGRARKVLLERYARNQLSPIEDVTGFKPDTRTIDEAGPRLIRGSLCDASERPKGIGQSKNAGGYLCNFIFYEAVRRFPEKRVGFVHVPSFERVPFEQQLAQLRELLGRIESS